MARCGSATRPLLIYASGRLEHDIRRIVDASDLPVPDWVIAGVGTLILAMGVGVLIGRSGDHSTTATPAAAQIIKVPAGGGAETTTASTGKAAAGGAAKGKPKKQNAAALKKEATTQKGAEEVLKPSAGVKLPPATVKPGGKCTSGTAGCKGGEFTGEYFGE